MNKYWLHCVAAKEKRNVMKLELYIRGGLGNQLYQYAAARYIQEKYGYDELIINSYDYRQYKIRNFEMENFELNSSVNITDKISGTKNMLRSGYRVYQKLYSMIKKKRAKTLFFKCNKWKYLLGMTEFTCPEMSQKDVSDMFMYGYFASSKPALEMKNKLMGEIKLSGERTERYKQLLDKVQSGKSIAVSIRCGWDYEKYGWPICSKEFYLSGLEKIKGEIGECNVFIFADDLQKVKNEEWFGGNVTYVEGLDVCESFELMRNCNNYVCSNSSFSWWGAFLSYSDSPIIYSSNRVFSKNSCEDDERIRLSYINYIDYLTGEDVKV